MKLDRPQKVGPVLGLSAALVAAAALLAIATADTWLAGRAVDLPRVGTLAALLLLATVALVWILRATHQGGRRRAFFTALGLLVVFAAAVEAALRLRPFPVYGAPVAMLSILGAAVLGRAAGLALAAAAAFVVTCLGPPDAALALVLFAQGAGGALGVPIRPKRGSGSLLVAGLAAAACAAATYATVVALKTAELPLAELRAPSESPWLWSAAGGAAGGLLAALLAGLVERLAGQLPRSTLVALADLEHPLLKKIATEAPGTWQHSLAMANFAEIAANAIGANALLVRVGAYFHDLGKALQPPYYIENLTQGQRSPHDAIDPQTSADAIFAHVTEGVRLARENGLPERIIDFMHMHHGDSVLEYFWGKCQEQGNPHFLREEAFRYPGVKPQSKETAILALCDAVEAGSRTLPRGDGKAIETLVSRIITTKLRQGQLDESGLTLAELRTLHDTLVATLKHANHARIEYPWQREARAAETHNLRNAPAAVAVTQEVSAPKAKAIIVESKEEDWSRILRDDD